MADFLLELLSEEIPARMQARARNDLGRLFAEQMADAGLAHGAVETYSTPRRLVLIARDLADRTPGGRSEEKGPRTSAPPQALEGFLRKFGVAREDLVERDGVWFLVTETAGHSAMEWLQWRIPNIVADFPWPKSMRWGDGSLRWVRPLHAIVAMLGEEIVPVEIDGISSGASTVGHRFHHPGPITVGGASDYIEKLRACHVIVDQAEREELIRKGAAKAAKAAGLTLLDDEGLVVENAGLTEWPVPLVGRFDADFLDVPREVIVLTMRTNQKYFACTNDEGLLVPAFVCVANIAASDKGKAIAEGNARVLAARLADARFFWEQDVKVPLEEQAKKLDGIVFHEKLGTVADKVARVAKLARWLVEEGIVKADADQVERAARLAKADLVTGMVGEFPELQGVIGGYLAETQGEPEAVADAIRDHYGTPSEPASIAVALADKLDTLVGFFLIQERPTGSRDPFALRRAAIGAVILFLESRLRLSLLNLLEKHLELVEVDALTARQIARKKAAERAGVPLGFTADATGRAMRRHPENDTLYSSTSWDLLDFFADRLKVQQREAGVRHDLIDAVFALGGEDDLVRLLARVNALQAFVETEDGTNLLVAYKRAANILKKEKWEGTEAAGGDELAPEEKALIAALDKAEPKASAAIDKEDFTGAMAALASLRKPIDDFFDHVTVNDPDSAKRERRLNLLTRFRDAVSRVADFSKIEG